MSVLKLIGLFILSIMNVGVLSKDLSKRERLDRANFVQKLVNRRQKLEGRIRLVGPTKYEGNVYIYHAGRWGAVCDDSWDDAAAQVVCRHLNRTGTATHGSQYGEARRKYWMDDVVCQGDELILSQCIFSGWGSSDCDTTEAAGAKCTIELAGNDNNNKIAENVDDKNVLSSRHEFLNLDDFSLRLVSPPNDSKRSTRRIKSGRVEILYNKIWGSICPAGWTLYEAMVVCRHLGMGYAEQALQTDYFGSSPILISSVSCYGNESNVFECRFQYGNIDCPSDKGHVAAVACTEYLADLVLDTKAIEMSAHLQDVPMHLLQCAMEENCLSKSAYEIQHVNADWHFETRRLLRFTTSSINMGNEEFRPYLPKHLWQWHLCHMHYHSMEVFATFDVLDWKGRRIAEGHKASFCLEDNMCMPGVEKKYSCKNYGDQGISINCSDVYLYNIDCQWVDVTDVMPGDYIFRVAVNPHARIAEQYFHNNAALCQLRLAETYARVYGCVLGRP